MTTISGYVTRFQAILILGKLIILLITGRVSAQRRVSDEVNAIKLAQNVLRSSTEKHGL